MLTQDRLRDLIHYDPLTGVFTWKDRPAGIAGWSPKRAGKEAGRIMKRRIPYRQIRADDRQYYAHRLAFLYMTGAWPTEYVDHIDHDGLNNRWDNLREATNQQNQWNAGMSARNKTGFKGVSFAKAAQKYQASITTDSKVYYLGQYATPEEAHAAYCSAARLHRGEFVKTE